MMKELIKILKIKKGKGVPEYKGLSDFFLHAPTEEKKKVIAEAAQKANENQLEIFKRAKLKIKAN
jgi:hypothetical protein